MLKKILLPTILLLLAYGFWVSPNFKIIAAGIAIFLFGMLAMEEGFRAFTGGGLERMLKRTTSSTGKSLLFGIISTTVMQSSSLVSVISISFLSAGLITLTAGIGIIFGANLGTTTGAWLIAGFGLKVNIAAYAMPMLAFGVILIFQSSKALKGAGYILAGLGFLFLGIHYMKDGFEAFKDTINLAEFAVSGYPGVLLFTTIGIFATVVMQSSHATLVLTITALAAGQITYENALALAIGANVGTTITAILGSMGANENGKRLAVAHLVFNTATGIIAIAFIYQLVNLVDWLSSLAGIAHDDYTLKLAVFHSVFNLLGIVIMLPVTGRLVSVLEELIPVEIPEVDQPKYLNEASAEFPGTAVEAIRMETLRVYEAAMRIIVDGLGMKMADVLSDTDLDLLAAKQSRVHQFDIDAMYERHIKGIYSAIVAFISETAFSRREEQSAQLQWLREANTYLVDAVKDADQLQRNLVNYIGSDIPVMHDIYNRLRTHIAKNIRELEETRTSGGGVMDVLELDSLKIMAEEEQNSLNQTITELIARHTITPSMGSSLVNDSMYSQNITLNLIRAAQTIFASAEEDVIQVAQEVMLDKSDLDRIVDQSSTNPGAPVARPE